MKKEYRQGAIGALLDEYEKSIAELHTVIATISHGNLVRAIDTETKDDDCRSVQTILSHVVHAGNGYATAIHNSAGNDMVRPAKTLHPTVQNYQDELNRMFLFTEQVLAALDQDDIVQHEDSRKILSNWGQKYDIEQMMEHAIVHILRHRRQIERFKAKL